MSFSLVLFAISAFFVSIAFYFGIKKLNITQPQRDFLAHAQEKAKYKPVPCAGVIFFLFFAIYSIFFGSIDYKFFTIFGFFLVGLLDDAGKVLKKSHISFLSGRKRLIVEIILATFFAHSFLNGNSHLFILKDFAIEIPFFIAMPAIAFIIVGTANAVNLTDGQDALAGKTVLVNLFFLLALFGFDGSIFLLILLLLAFLLFNAKPATIYMGDSGSLFLGSFLAIFFLTYKIEAILPVTGIIFVLEALSVIIQVYYFKLTKGKRIFKMSPLHHHFELSGYSEEKIVNTAFVVTTLAAFASYWFLLSY